MPDEAIVHTIYSLIFGHVVPADLKLVLAWLAAGIVSIFVPVLNQTPVRFVFSLPVMLFIPGYSLISALYPRADDITLIERFTLSCGVSIAVVPLIGLGLNFTPWGIRLEPIVISLTLFTLVMVIIAHYTRALLPSEEQFRIAFFTRERIRRKFLAGEAGSDDRLLNIVLAIALLIVVITTVFVFVIPREGEHFTEFFILGENRTAASYPDQIIPGNNYQMYVGIGNHEYRNVRYTIETWILRTEFDNVTNSTRIVAMDPNDRLFLSLYHNETTIIPYNLSVKKNGYNRMEFLLFNETVPGFEVTGSDRINASYSDLHLGFSVNDEH